MGMKDENSAPEDNNEIDIEKTQVAPEEEEDDVVEFVFNDDGEEDLKATLKKLRKDVKEAKKEKDEYLANWQRERADFANFKREGAAILERVKEQGIEKTVDAILPALDSFDMAMGNRDAWEKVDANWRMGVEYIRSQFKNALESVGVNEINPTAESAFDPMQHESIGTEETDDVSKDHTVATVVQKGYKIGDKIIRAARVRLFKAE